MATKLIALLTANGLTLWLLARLIPEQVGYDQTWATVVAFAAVLALLNLLLAPVLRMLTWPLSCLTLGLFSVVVSGVVFYLGGALVAGVHVSFVGALIGGAVAGFLSSLLLSALRRPH